VSDLKISIRLRPDRSSVQSGFTVIRIGRNGSVE